MRVELVQDKGEGYKKIKPKESQSYCIVDSEKNKVAENCKNLDAEAFASFDSVFKENI